MIGLPWVENREPIIFESKKSKKIDYFWYDQPPKSTQTKRQDIIKIKPGLTSYSKDSDSGYEFFKLFLDDEAFNLILNSTNQKLKDFIAGKKIKEDEGYVF